LHIENSGPGLAREAGRQVARGDFIQYLDSDDWLLPEKFALQLAAIERTPQADIVYGVTQLVDETGKVLLEPSKQTGVRRDTLFPALLVDRWWHTSTPLYSKRISDLAGAWPDKRPEDWDLEARMGAHNPKLAYVDSAVSCHLDHDDPQRVSRGKYLSYLLDEAWFLPRLYQCAKQVGVPDSSTEMQHFSKWCFMRARHLGLAGRSDLADELFDLSIKSADLISYKQRIARLIKPVIGWRVLGLIGQALEKISGGFRL